MGRGRLGLGVVAVLVVVLKLGKAEGPSVVRVDLVLLVVGHAVLCVGVDGPSLLLVLCGSCITRGNCFRPIVGPEPWQTLAQPS